nr:RpiB/LacA/LacB family sugar-phosphate isomerase [uncultured Cohaesibacter sp.]
MRIAVAGDSAGEGLAHILAEYLAGQGKYEVSEVSRISGAADPFYANMAERAALSNNAQIITMGARVIGAELAKSIADTFFENTEFFDANGRSAGNVNAIDELDARNR